RRHARGDRGVSDRHRARSHRPGVLRRPRRRIRRGRAHADGDRDRPARHGEGTEARPHRARAGHHAADRVLSRRRRTRRDAGRPPLIRRRERAQRSQRTADQTETISRPRPSRASSTAGASIAKGPKISRRRAWRTCGSNVAAQASVASENGPDTQAHSRPTVAAKLRSDAIPYTPTHRNQSGSLNWTDVKPAKTTPIAPASARNHMRSMLAASLPAYHPA